MLSIITVTYNAADTIEECLCSVRNQGIDVEHILIDGASTDNTIKILEKYKKSFKYFISEADHGIYDAMNKGLKLATGDVVGILNADDYYASNDVLKKVENVFRDKSVDACYGDLIYFSVDNPKKILRFWKAGDFSIKKMYWGWMPPHPTFFVRRSVYEKFGLFNLELGTASDYEIMLRFLLKHKIKVKYISDVLVNMRSGGASNVSLSNRLRANMNDHRAWQVNDLKPYLWTVWVKPLRKIGQWFNKK